MFKVLTCYRNTKAGRPRSLSGQLLRVRLTALFGRTLQASTFEGGGRLGKQNPSVVFTVKPTNPLGLGYINLV